MCNQCNGKGWFWLRLMPLRFGHSGLVKKGKRRHKRYELKKDYLCRKVMCQCVHKKSSK